MITTTDTNEPASCPIAIVQDPKGVPCVNARDLHAFLEVGKVFGAWITDRIKKLRFIQGQDFVVEQDLSFPNLESSKSRQQVTKEYFLSMDMAKHLAMLERNEKGHQARQYFIACEKRAEALAAPAPYALPSYPEALRALADKTEENERLLLTNSALNQQVDEAAPKLVVHDQLMETDGTYSVAQAAQLAGLPYGSTTLFRVLRERGHFFRNSRGQNDPYQEYVDRGYYVRKIGQYVNDDTQEIVPTITIRVTAKGIAWIIKRLKSDDGKEAA